MTARVRLVDDDADLLAAQVQALKIAGFQPEPFGSASDALRGLGRDYPGVVLTDVRMPGMDGFELQRRLQALDPDLPVILLTGHGDVPMAVAALKAGAYDFLTKPVSTDELTAAIRRAAAARALVIENRLLRALHPAEDKGLLGDSPVMRHLRETVARVAEAGVDALIVGPGGVGKEAVAREIHRQSPRRTRAFVHLACAAIDETRFEADVLGVEPAPRNARKPGAVERSSRGTLYLDEIEALPLPLQARLMAVIEAREIWPAGATTARPLDLRVLAATRADLPQLVQEGRFRSDLYYRLSGIILTVPPLADRREDVPILFRHFLLADCRRLNRPVPEVTALVQARLIGHPWPGNVRELKQFAERQALGLSPFDSAGMDEDAPGLADLTAAYEAELIREALRLADGNAARALAQLRLPRKTFYDKLARHGIRPADFRS